MAVYAIWGMGANLQGRGADISVKAPWRGGTIRY